MVRSSAILTRGLLAVAGGLIGLTPIAVMLIFRPDASVDGVAAIVGAFAGSFYIIGRGLLMWADGAAHSRSMSAERPRPGTLELLLVLAAVAALVASAASLTAGIVSRVVGVTTAFWWAMGSCFILLLIAGALFLLALEVGRGRFRFQTRLREDAAAFVDLLSRTA